MKSRMLLVSVAAIVVAAFAWGGCSSDEEDGAAGAAGSAGTAGKAGAAGKGGAVNKGGAAGEAGAATGGAAGSTAGSAGTGTGGSAGGSTDCTGILQAGECATCLETDCCAELAACGTNECLDCAISDTGCDATTTPLAEALLACLDTKCKDQCTSAPPPEVEPACDAPMTTLGAGACFTAGTDDTCNPLTNAECATDGTACDWYEGAYSCYTGNTIALCGECGASETEWCQAGMTCMPIPGGTAYKCVKYCCDDSECGTGKCDKVVAKDYLPGGLGLCVAGSTPPVDGGTEAAVEAGPEAAVEAGPEAAVEAGEDAPAADVAVDAPAAD